MEAGLISLIICLSFSFVVLCIERQGWLSHKNNEKEELNKKKNFDVLMDFLNNQNIIQQGLGACEQSSKFKELYPMKPGELCLETVHFGEPSYLNGEDQLQILIAEGINDSSGQSQSEPVARIDDEWNHKRVVIFNEKKGLRVFDFFRKEKILKELEIATCTIPPK